MTDMNGTFLWRRTAGRSVASVPATVQRPPCAMLALRDGRPQGTQKCRVPGCDGSDRCSVMSDLHQLGGHIRRVRRQIEHERRQPSMTGRAVRLTAARLAYTDLLQQACTMLSVPTDLPHCSGMARNLEILRVESVLARYGIGT